MSLGEGLDDVSLLDSAADKINQKVISRYQSRIINDEQHLINDDQGREIHSALDESTYPSGLSKEEEKQQFQIIVKKDLQDPER